MDNIDLISKSRKDLEGNWLLAIATMVVYIILVGCPSIILVAGSFITLIIGGPLAFGMVVFTLSIIRKSNPQIENLFSGFQLFTKTLVAYLLMSVAVLIGFILLIIPGIILALGFFLTFYIMADNPEISSMDALKQSWDMMNGYKSKLFVLGLIFFGLSLLCILTFGLGFIWLIPVMQVTYANFYEDVKNNTVIILD